MVVLLQARNGVAQGKPTAGSVRPGIDVLVEDSIGSWRVARSAW